MVPGIWMKLYVRFVQVINSGCAIKAFWIGSSQNMCSFCSIWTSCSACCLATSTVLSTSVTAVKARPNWYTQ